MQKQNQQSKLYCSTHGDISQRYNTTCPQCVEVVEKWHNSLASSQKSEPQYTCPAMEAARREWLERRGVYNV